MFRTTYFPEHRQLDQMDCGPTCLKIITEFYGRNYSLNYLRDISSLQKGGVSLEGLSEAVNKLGMSSVAIKAGFQELLKEVPLPAIAHWEGNHFLVVYKTTSRFIHVSDPALGKLKYTHKEFVRKWGQNSDKEGILLLVEESGLYEVENHLHKNYKGISFLIAYLKPYSSFIGQVLLGLTVTSLIQLILPFLTQTLVDQGINYENVEFINLVLIAQVVLFLTLSFIEIIRDWVLLHISTRINIKMISDFLDKLLTLPVSFFDSKTTGDFMQRLNDHSRIDEFLGGRFLTIPFDLFSIISFGIVLSLFDRNIFLIFFLGCSAFIGWSLLFMKKKEILDHRLFNFYRQEQSILLQIFKSVVEIKLNNSEDRRKTEWEKIQIELFLLKSKLLKIDQLQINGGRAIRELTQIFIIFWSAKSVIAGEITLGTMLAIQFIIASITVPLTNSIYFVLGLQHATLSLERLSEIHSQRKEDQNLPPRSVIVKGDLKLNELSYKIKEAGTEYLLKDISVVIPQGKVTAIVGPSGSGKTTLLKVLLKLYEPSKGSIEIEGQDLKYISAADWRNLCSTVLQDGVLFCDSIERNITESRSGEPTDWQRMSVAIKMANLSSLIENLPLGFETKIGEQGQLLSGGEKQRLMIARAIYKDANYLFFDEATSSLDSENEKVISENLKTFYGNKTVIIVAHRLSTVKNADQILVMNNGSLVEKGTHSELVASEGVYHSLIKNQL